MDRRGVATAVATRRVVVVDDHRTVAELLALAIDGADDLTCVGVAHDVAAAECMTDALRPDVLVTDVRLGDPQRDGTDLCASLVARHPDLLVVLLTGDTGCLTHERVRACGATAIFAKDGNLATLLETLSTATRDRLVIDPGLLHRLLATSPGRPAPDLSPRERDVLELLATGLDASRIARRLGIRTSTCRGYIKAVLHKLGAHSQLEAVATARRRGLLSTGP